jgi:[glutamine synthetase] adenylyltransferase / [glutamine synthetase]-adenylyl-L-tyrosine phosphorylase
VSTLDGLLAARHAELEERAPDAAARLAAEPPARRAAADRVLLASDFVLRSLTTEPALLGELLDIGALDVPRDLADYRRVVGAALADARALEAADEAPAMRALRRLRRREMVRIAWRDLAGDADTDATLREASAFAEAVVEAATRIADGIVARRHGRPPGDPGLVVLGMGKLGGGELNFSSDIDLVYLHPDCDGDTDGPSPVAAQEFFVRQGRLLIRLLDARTEDGFVFRTDLRLRPFGDSGPLVPSFAAFEDYVQVHGRDWERYAYVKARALAGADAFRPLGESVLRPFVYRRYLDFGVFDSLRDMKALIAREVQRRDRQDDVKRGPGGIREIEFIVQAFQLIRGGQDRGLRDPSLLAVLPRLRGAKLLPDAAVAELAAAYRFLRRLENRLQMLDDQQTHELPQDPVARQRIARAMDCDDTPALLAALARQRAVVTRHFDALVATPSDDPEAAPAATKLDVGALWDAPGRDSFLERLTALGLPEPAEVLRLLEGLRDAGRIRRLDETGRRRLQSLLQVLLPALPVAEPLAVLRRLVAILEAIGQRSAYFALLLENRAARRRLVEVCGYGNFLASQVAAHPLLLDELIDDRVLDALPDRASLAAELESRIGGVDEGDADRQVEALARFKQAAVFRVALADLSGRLPLMQVSDRLTEIAELIVDQSIHLAWTQMTAQLGTPHCTEDGGARRAVRVAAFGYGKLGGHELGYASDLDLVFLHDSCGETQETDGANPVDNQVFFLRFAQRLVHLLTIHSAAGRLYEVDMRLRPSGKGGFLVTSIDAFRHYQFAEAWTWEHQALLHARAVAGDPVLRERADAVRIEALRGAVRRADLREQVRDMRERMRREHASTDPSVFDLKQDRGGIADIEFLAQYWALRWADDYPPVAHYSDTIRQLESVASAALVPQETVDELVGAYQRYRARGHRLALDALPNRVNAGEFAGDRARVAAIWRATMEDA